MALNPACVGRHYVGALQVVGAERARRFAEAIGSDGRAPGAVPTLAATYLLAPVVDLLFGDDEVGLDLARLVHAEQTFEFLRPPRLGESLLPEGTIARVETRRHLEVLQVDLCARDRSGSAITRATTVFVIRPGAPPPPEPGG